MAAVLHSALIFAALIERMELTRAQFERVIRVLREGE
jgi:hypothetical protein